MADLEDVDRRFREIIATIPAGDRVFLVEVLTADDATRPNVIGNLHATAMVPPTVELLIDAEEAMLVDVRLTKRAGSRRAVPLLRGTPAQGRPGDWPRPRHDASHGLVKPAPVLVFETVAHMIAWEVSSLKRSHLLVVAALLTTTLGISSSPADAQRGVPGRGALFRIVAIAPDDVWAFGWRGGTRLRGTDPLIVHWNGATWTSVTPPVATGVIHAASASGPDDVWILGETERLGHCHSYIREFDGTSWNRVPGGHGCRWDSLLALAPDDVWIGGEKLLHWDGSSWDSAWTIPCRVRDCYQGWIADLDAGAATDVWGVGSPAVTAHMGPRGWRSVRPAIPRKPPRWRSQTLDFRSVATVGSRVVWAVGEVYRVGEEFWVESDRLLAERWNGEQWLIIRTPDLPGAAEVLNAVAHAGGITWAVGNSLGSHGRANGGVVMRKQGDRWQILPLPTRVRDLYDAAALSSTDAWAVGTWKSAPGVRVPLILQWDGTIWSRVPVP